MKGATYNQLAVFSTIVKEGSIRGAARQLEIAAPSVSQSLKSLEAKIGMPLFSRSTRRIELTQAGQLLYERIGDHLSSLELAVDSLQDLNKAPSGRVRITLPKFVYDFLLKPYYAQFCHLYPDIELEISISDKVVNILDEGFDVGIRFGHRIQDGMVARPLTSPMKEALFASKDYLAKYGSPKTLSDVSEHKFIQYRFIGSNQIAPLLLNDNGQQHTVRGITALIVNDTDAMIDAAIKGLGIGRIVTPMIENQFTEGQLSPLLEQYWDEYPGLYIYFMQNSQKARRVRVLIDFLLDSTTHFRV